MKVALLTFHDTTNFGSFLQTYGLYHALTALKLECEVLNYQCDAIVEREIPADNPRSFKPKNIAKKILIEPPIMQKYIRMKNMLNQMCQCSLKVYNKTNVCEAISEYDAFVVGSDMLWNTSITNNDLTYFLDFVPDKSKKFAFSTSIGKAWNDKEKATIKPLLCSFNRISVREYVASEWVKELTGYTPPVVCDPTMMLSGKEWTDVMLSNETVNKIQYKYVLVYFVSPKILQDAQLYCKRHNCKLVCINYYKPIFGCKNVKPTSVEDFLKLFINADAVFTASYHGMMFSIYFEKEFYYYARSTASRFDTVATKLDLLTQRCDNKDDFVENSVDYSAVTPKVEKWRNESLNVLKEYWHA